ncbi:MAG: hypothetical protein M1836_004098 [Candelina mexicana]|nr:MAG: hypothetical protein M1836_004098 [Candelina mexicana]
MAGFQTLYDGAKDLLAEQGAVDIIALHGLGANSNYAWLRKKNVAEGQHEDVNWLSQLLPNAIPSARIRCFDYDSRWIGQDLPKQRLTLIAEQLLDAFHHSVIHPDRPVIFIGHSFGGIVIEKALVLANSDGSKYQHLIKVTAGVVFLGTPHRGSRSQSWGDLIAKSAAAVGFSERRLLKDLDMESDTLRDLVHYFTSIVGRHSIPVICFFELYETDFGRRLPGVGPALSWSGTGKSMIVDESSGTIPGLDRLALQTDHFKINKFGKADDPTYMSVSRNIVEYAQGAWDLVRPRLRAQLLIQDDTKIQNTKELECLRALFLTDPVDDKRKLIIAKGKRVNGTCEWIRTNELYLSWQRDLHSRILWISGSPGKGKTMLSIFLTEELTKVVEQSDNAILAYDFCDGKNANRSTGTTILRGLMLQMLRQRPSLFRHIMKDFELQKERLFDSSSASEALWRIFKNMVLELGVGDIYCVIDGLDECESSSLETFLAEMQDFHAQGHPKLSGKAYKFLLVSRSRPDFIQRALDKFHRIKLDPELNTEVNHDVQLYVEDQVGKVAQENLWPQDLRHLVEDDMLKKSNGTFLWVSLVARQLSRVSACEVFETLEVIPEGLDELYDRMLLQIRETRRSVASRILLWVTNAIRPLTLLELATAIGTKSQRALSIEEIIRQQVGFCGDLLHIDEASGEVGMVHQSVKDYLQKQGISTRPNIRHFPCWGTGIKRHYYTEMPNIPSKYNSRRRDLEELSEVKYPDNYGKGSPL